VRVSLSPGDAERLRTWAVEIATALLPDAPQRDEGHDRRFGDAGGLVIDKRRGCWWSYSAGRGGWSIVDLIALIKNDWSRKDAEQWALAWLASHSGTGCCTADHAEDDDADLGDGAASRATAFHAREILNAVGPIKGTPAEAYLSSRGLPGAYPDCAQWLPNARAGEGAFVGILRSHDRIVGMQLTYLDPMGRKSLIEPVVQRFMLEKAPGAVFEIYPTPADNIKDIKYDLVITEGLEDGLSNAWIQRPCRVIALPGIGSLKHIPVKKGERVLVVCDGDDPASAAHKGLVAGLDNLLLQTSTVWRTKTPTGEDANSVLMRGGAVALKKLQDEAVPAELSPDGEAVRLSRLDRVSYDRECKATAKKLDIRTATLREMVAEKRRQSPPEEPDTIGQGSQVDIPSIEPWPEPVDGAALLDCLARAIKRYVIVSDIAADAMALWTVRSHAHEAFDTNPPLWLRSVMKRSGKTRTCESLDRTVAASLFITGITASALLRVIEKHRPTIILDARSLPSRRRSRATFCALSLRRSSMPIARSRTVSGTLPMPDRMSGV
jgi:hypothetical protein